MRAAPAVGSCSLLSLMSYPIHKKRIRPAPGPLLCDILTRYPLVNVLSSSSLQRRYPKKLLFVHVCGRELS
ncbi:hypothetical protein BS50DRAFT_142073 [Corynespora cassiicola Philippines]|uniref:Uncharacterized protein n=1 Tax=Corynespora cassiicola Philippines TaxID=1448308 RepID=A0A2T2NA97_CORCC|nr:hypothetical protein BS50DRAFT_142073 [Corynespora cassiicola Philippines]